MNKPAFVLSWICFAFSVIAVIWADAAYWFMNNVNLAIACCTNSAAWALIALYLRWVARGK